MQPIAIHICAETGIMKLGAYLIAGSVVLCCEATGSVFGQQHFNAVDFPTTAEPAQSAPAEFTDHHFGTTAHPATIACYEKLVNWTSLCKLRVAAIAMQRTRTGSSSIVQDDLGNDVINSSQFDFDFASGIDVGLLCPLTKNWDLSFRYFGLESVTASAAGNITTVDGAIATSPPSVVAGGGPVSFTYRSRLQSGEVNLGTSIGEGSSFFVGFRTLELREQMSGRFQSLDPFVYNVNTSNNLYGFQAGAETTIWQLNDRLRMDCFGKAGILANFADQDSSILQPPGTVFTSASARDRIASLLAEAGVVATCKLTRCCNLQVGYQVLWMNGVALASEQTSSTGDLNIPGVVTNVGRSDVLYHGGFLGLEFSY